MGDVLSEIQLKKSLYGHDAMAADRIVTSHEALRAQLAAAEERADKAERERQRCETQFNLAVAAASRAEAERDQAIAERDAERRWIRMEDELQAQVRTLREALTKYGWHTNACTWTRGDAPGRGRRPCTCGFDAALGENNDE